MSDKKKGFAAMDPEKLRELARRAGKKSAKSKRHREWTVGEARYWSRAGGFARHGVKKIKI